MGADAIGLATEAHIDEMYHPHEPYKSMKIGHFHQEPLLQKVMENGKMLIDKRPLQDIASYSRSRLKELPLEYKRFNNPHIYKIGISARLQEEREKLIQSHKNNAL